MSFGPAPRPPAGARATAAVGQKGHRPGTLLPDTPSAGAPHPATPSLKDLQPVDWQVEAGRVKRVVSSNSVKSRLGNWVWGVADDPGAPPGLSTLEWGTPAPVPLLTEGCSIW